MNPRGSKQRPAGQSMWKLEDGEISASRSQGHCIIPQLALSDSETAGAMERAGVSLTLLLLVGQELYCSAWCRFLSQFQLLCQRLCDFLSLLLARGK